MTKTVSFKIKNTQIKFKFGIAPFADLFRDHLIFMGVKINRKLKGKDES